MSTKNLIQFSQKAIGKKLFVFHGAQILHELSFVSLPSRYTSRMLQMWFSLLLDVL